MSIFKNNPIQYLVSYVISGSSLGTGCLTAIDFDTSKIEKTAGATAYNILECIVESVNNDPMIFTKFQLKEPLTISDIGIVSISRIN